MKSLTPEDLRRWPLVEDIYIQHGSPTREKIDQLAAAMKEIIERCYIPVVYKRYKQLLRKQWPEKPIPAIPQPKPTEAQIIARAKNIYPPEQFERWLAMHEAAKNITPSEPQSVIPIEKGRKAHG